MKLVIIQRDRDHSGLYWVWNQDREREGIREEVSKMVSADK